MEKKKIIDTFLHNCKILVNSFTNILPENDPTFYRLNKRILLAIQYDPLYVFSSMGKKLYEYRDFVYNENIEVESLMKKIKNENKIINPDETTEVILFIIKYIEEEFKKTENDDNKRFFRKLLSELLDGYVEYKYIEINKED